MADEQPEEKQCRICLDNTLNDLELGKLIRPCLCKGSISYVHVKCLQRWRNTSSSRSAFYACPQCRYQYHFARTRVSGIATNPVIVGVISAVVFTAIVMSASFITTKLIYDDDNPTQTSYFYFSPWIVFRNLITASVRYITGITENPLGQSEFSYYRAFKPQERPSLLRRLLNRFLLGLPVVGAGSILHILLTLPTLPLHWFRVRTRQNRDSRDYMALIMIVIVIIGLVRAIWKVYRLTESVVQRLLLRAEDIILEVQ